MGVGGQRHALAALPPGKTRYPLYRRLGGPQGRSGRVRKFSPPSGFDPRTVQPVASRYIDWAIAASCSMRAVAIYSWHLVVLLWLRGIFVCFPLKRTTNLQILKQRHTCVLPKEMQGFCFSKRPYRLCYPPSHVMGTGVKPCMPLYAFVAWTGATVPLRSG